MVAIVEGAGAPPDNHPQTAIYLRIERGRERVIECVRESQGAWEREK